MLEILTNVNLLEYSQTAWSSAIMIILIFALIFMLNRSQNRYLKIMDKYAILIEKQIKTNTELTMIINNQNNQINNIINLIKYEKK